MNDSNQHIDDLVRQRLQELPISTPPPGGWAALQRKFDGDADMVLRNALTGLSAGTAPTGWEALERKLDPQTAADQQLADRLNKLKPAPPTGWESLVARMDRENDEAIDAIVTDGLARTTPTVTSGWAALAARLELIGWRRSTVAAWKLTECCLLLSLLLLFVRFGPTPPANPTFAKLAEGFPLPLQVKLNNSEMEPAAEQEPTKQVLATSLAKAPELFTTTVEKPQPTASPSQLTPHSSTPPLNRAVAPLPASTDLSVLAVASQSDLRSVDAPSSREEVYLPDNVSSLAIDELKTRLYPPSPALLLPKRDNSEPIYYYLNGFISPVYLNQVITPATEILEFDIAGGRRITYGKSAGLMLDVMHGKNGLQFGFIYNRRSYIPTALKYWQEGQHAPTALAYDGGYNRFVFDALEIQFNYKRAVFETEKWRFSGKIGMGIDLVAYADFEDQERFVSEFNDFLEWAYSQPAQPSQPFGPPGDARSSPGDTQGDQLTEPAAGFLEGGGVFDNSSLYFNGGIVVERLINQRWSVYVAPSFGRAIYLRKDQGIGPYKDRINPAGLRFGSRYHFGGK